MELALKLWIGLPHTLKVGIKLACTQTLFYLFENIVEAASEVSARERAHYPFALAVNKSPAVYILSPSPRSTDFEEKIEGLWTGSYHVTSVENCQSTQQKVPVGVPQGSIRGPLLFLIYVNDLPNCLEHCQVVIYADDTVVYFDQCKLLSKYWITPESRPCQSCRTGFNNNCLTLNTSKSKWWQEVANPSRYQACHWSPKTLRVKIQTSISVLSFIRIWLGMSVSNHWLRKWIKELPF